MSLMEMVRLKEQQQVDGRTAHGDRDLHVTGHTLIAHLFRTMDHPCMVCDHRHSTCARQISCRTVVHRRRSGSCPFRLVHIGGRRFSILVGLVCCRRRHSRVHHGMPWVVYLVVMRCLL